MRTGVDLAVLRPVRDFSIHLIPENLNTLAWCSEMTVDFIVTPYICSFSPLNLNWLFFKHVLAIIGSLFFSMNCRVSISSQATAIVDMRQSAKQIFLMAVFLWSWNILSKLLNLMVTLFLVTVLAARSATALGTQHTTFKWGQKLFYVNKSISLWNKLLLFGELWMRNPSASNVLL